MSTAVEFRPEVLIDVWPMDIVERWKISRWLRGRCRTAGEVQFWLAVYDGLAWPT